MYHRVVFVHSVGRLVHLRFTYLLTTCGHLPFGGYSGLNGVGTYFCCC